MGHGSPSLAEFPPLSYATAVSATHSNHRLLSSPSSHYRKPSYSSSPSASYRKPPNLTRLGSPSASYRKPLILTRPGQSPRMLRAAVNPSTDTRAQILKTHPSVGLSPRNTNTSTPPRGGEGRRVQHTGQTVQATSHALPPPRRIVKAVRRGGGRGGGGCGSNSMAVSPAKPRHTPCTSNKAYISTPLASSASTMYYPSSSSSSGRAKATPTSGIPKPLKRVRGDGNNNAAPGYAPNAPKTPTVPKKRMR